MGRQYTIEAYLELVERLRAAIPGISLTTDVIVGFCGETEAQFEHTLALLRDVRFETGLRRGLLVSGRARPPRASTTTCRAPRRSAASRRCSTSRRASAAKPTTRGSAGRHEVLVDQVRPPSSHDGGAPRVAGRNRNNKLVHFDGSPDLLGRLVDVKIERAGPYALVGARAGGEAPTR